MSVNIVQTVLLLNITEQLMNKYDWYSVVSLGQLQTEIATVGY